MQVLTCLIFYGWQNNSYYQLGEDVSPDTKWNEQDITDLPLPVLDELLYTCQAYTSQIENVQLQTADGWMWKEN